MNKKFSTLLAGAALLGAVTANAGGPVKTVAADGLYQLAVDVTGATTGTDKVLTMDKDGKLLPLTYNQIAANPDTLAYSLWCVEAVSYTHLRNEYVMEKQDIGGRLFYGR